MTASPACGSETPNNDTVGLVLSGATRELESQGQDFHQLDAKTGVMMGFALLFVAQILAALFRMSQESIAIFTHFPIRTSVLFLAGMTSLVAGVAFSCWSLLPKNFESFTVFPEFKFLHCSPDQMRQRMLDGLDSAIKTNADVFEQKSRRFEIAVCFISVGIFCFVLLTVVMFTLMH